MEKNISVGKIIFLYYKILIISYWILNNSYMSFNFRQDVNKILVGFNCLVGKLNFISENHLSKIKFLIMKYFYAAGNVILHGTRHLIVLDSHVTGYSNVLNIKFRLFKNLGIFHSNGIKSRDKHTFYSDMIKTKIFNNFNSSYIINQFNFS